MQQRQVGVLEEAHWGRIASQYAGRTFTAEEFAQLADDGNRYELVAGKVLQMPPPRNIHGQIQGFIITLLNVYLWQAGIGGSARTETGYVLSVPGEADTVLGPDVSYIAPGRLEATSGDETYEHIAPDWVIEIASPSQSRKELLEKVRVYLAAGVKLVWLVWPAPQFIEVWQGNDATIATAQQGAITRSAVFTANDTITGTDVLPDFACTLTDIFEGRGQTDISA
jgi:Uma2 family endonuclease